MQNTDIQANFIDRHVGARTRALRLQRGISQSELASELGVSFQQVQKYETGANRVSASKLYTIARVLKVKPGYFFDGLDDSFDGLDAVEHDMDIVELDVDAARIAALISKIPSKENRASLRELIKQMTLQ